MRLLFFNLGVLFFSLCVSAQVPKCCSSEKQMEWFRQHPDQYAAYLSRKAALMASQKDAAAQQGAEHRPVPAAPLFTIPVVFHILHVGGQENISDAQVQDAVSILNRDYNRRNADTANVVAQF